MEIEDVVLVTQENRSFDRSFGPLSGGRSLARASFYGPARPG